MDWADDKPTGRSLVVMFTDRTSRRSRLKEFTRGSAAVRAGGSG